MQNPNAPLNRLKTHLKSRWQAPDYPGGAPRFQMKPFGIDIGVFVLLPAAAVFFSRGLSEAASAPRRLPARQVSADSNRYEANKSQVVEFRDGIRSQVRSVGRRAPGALVRVRLLNVVESYSTAPVHVQIVDAGLGTGFRGGTLIGDGNSDGNFDRLNITFKFARDSIHEGVAYPISARALSLNGTLGLEAVKKEGAFARAAYGSTTSGASAVEGNIDSMDLKSIVIKALTAGLAQEFGNNAQVERNRAAVLSLQPGLEFFAELTDYFPSAGR